MIWSFLCELLLSKPVYSVLDQMTFSTDMHIKICFLDLSLIHKLIVSNENNNLSSANCLLVDTILFGGIN